MSKQNLRFALAFGLGIAVALAAWASIGTASAVVGNRIPGFPGYGMTANAGQNMMMNGNSMEGMMQMMSGSTNMAMGGGSSQMMGSNSTNGMMGSMGSAMNGMMAPTSSIDNATFDRINSPPQGVAVDRATNTIYVNASSLTVPIEASPLWYPHSGEYWLMYGLVNPTIVLKQGTEIDFLFINMDNETHVPGITALSPPYSYMPMMDGMMGDSPSRGAWLATGPMLPGVANTTSINPLYSDSIIPVTFSDTGIFWYLCLYPGHAQMGMYGEILVEG